MAYDVDNFEEEVIRRSQTVPVLVDFWAEWCGPCRILSPVLERLAEGSENRWKLAKVNTEQFPDVAAQYGIQSIPNVKLFFEGKIAAEFVGALPEYAVKEWLRKNVPSRHAADIESAKKLIRERRYAEAVNLLVPALGDEPDNQEAKALLAMAEVFRDPEEAQRLLKDVDDPRYGENTETVATMARLVELNKNTEALPDSPYRKQYADALARLAAQEFDKALALFIAMIRNDRYYDDDGARKACIAIFRFLGEEHPITQKHRRDFSSALY